MNTLALNVFEFSLLVLVFKLKGDGKNRSDFILRFKIDRTVELVDDLLNDNKSQANSVLIKANIILYLTKKLKHLISILILDS
jgi:hypothetical protein